MSAQLAQVKEQMAALMLANAELSVQRQAATVDIARRNLLTVPAGDAIVGGRELARCIAPRNRGCR